MIWCETKPNDAQRRGIYVPRAATYFLRGHADVRVCNACMHRHALYDVTGKMHMWAAEMSNHVGIKAWITNSQVVHAVADAPDATPFDFTRKEVVQPVFAHEPTVSRAPGGAWVMYYTTNYGEVPGSQCNLPCSCGSNGTSCLSCPNDQQCHASPQAPLSTRMSFSNSTEGPWSTPVLVPASGGGDTNLACTDDAIVAVVYYNCCRCRSI